MIRFKYFLAVSCSVFGIGAAHAAPCVPANAPAGSMGCMSDIGPAQSTDELLIWRPSLFPNSNGVLSIQELINSIAAAPFTGLTVDGTTNLNGPVNVTGNLIAPVLATGSITARSLSARYAEVYNVLDNGIVCNGTVNGIGTDNGSAFATLMSKVAAVASASNRVAVYFPPCSGYYLTGTSIAPPSYTDLLANPGTAVIAPTAASSAGNGLDLYLNGTDQTIDGLTFEGGLDYSPVIASAGRVILVYGDSNLTMKNNTFRHTRGIALEVSQGALDQNIQILNNRFFDIGNYWKTTLVATDRNAAINFDNAPTNATLATDVLVSGNELSDIGLDPIAVNGRRIRILGNKIYLTNGPAQWGTVTFTGSANFPDSIDGTGSGVTVSGNTIYGSPGMCIAYGASNLSITGNVCDSAGGSGVLFSGQNVTVTGNTINDPVQSAGYSANPTWNAGITAEGLSANAVISSNVITDSHVQYADVTSNSAIITNLKNTSYFAVGNPISNLSYFPSGTTVTAINSPTSITASNVALATNKQAQLTIGTPTMTYCFQGAGPNLSAATGGFVNVDIEQSNQCSGYTSGVFAPAGTAGWDVALGYGNNYSTSLTPQSLIGVGASTGAANTQVVTANPPVLNSLAPGTTLTFIPGYTNSGALTLNASATGAIPVDKVVSGALTALTGGEIVAGIPSTEIYTGSVWVEH